MKFLQIFKLTFSKYDVIFVFSVLFINILNVIFQLFSFFFRLMYNKVVCQ